MATSAHERTTDRVVIVLASLALLGGLVETIQSHGDGESSASEHLLPLGSPAPPFTVVSHARPEKRLTESDLHGKVVLLDFWATWCGPCREEAPRVLDLARRTAAAGDVAVLSVDVDDGAPAEVRSEVEKTLHDEALEDLPVYYGTAAMPGDFLASSLPTLYVLDKKGVVRFAAVGTTPLRTLVDAVEAARKE